MAILKDVTKTCIRLLLDEPFFGHYLAGLPKEISEKTDSAAIGLMSRQMVKLLVNGNVWDSFEEARKYGLIKHEVLHLVFGHLILQRQFAHKTLFNIAADVVVNQYIQKEQLHAESITFERLEYLEKEQGIEWKKGMDVGYYYRQLSKIQKRPKSGKNALSNRDLNLSELLKGAHPDLKKHRFWSDFQSLSPAEAKMVENQIENNFRQSMRRVQGQKHHDFEYLPDGLKERLEAKLETLKPTVNWKRVLRLFASTSNSTSVKNTLRRPSKRYGTTPGIQIKRRNKILIALDTSGSIRLSEIEDFFNEIYQIWRQGAEVYILECDSKIRKQYSYKGEMPNEIKGRGQTDMTPAIEFANQKYRPDAILIFTDGFVPPPKVELRCPALWIISSEGRGIEDVYLDKLRGRKLKIFNNISFTKSSNII